jgi:hypothetical protein
MFQRSCRREAVRSVHLFTSTLLQEVVNRAPCAGREECDGSGCTEGGVLKRTDTRRRLPHAGGQREIERHTTNLEPAHA